MNNNCSGCGTNVAVKTKSTSLAAVQCTNPLVYFFEQIRPYVDNGSYDWPNAVNLTLSNVGIVQQNGNLCCSDCENDTIKQVYYFGQYDSFLRYAEADYLLDNPDSICCLNKYATDEPDAIDEYFGELLPPNCETDFVDCLDLWPPELLNYNIVEYGNFGSESALCTIWNYFNDLGVSSETMFSILGEIFKFDIMVICHGCDIFIGSAQFGLDFMTNTCLLNGEGPPPPPPPGDPFRSYWDTTQGSGGNTIVLPLYSGGTYNFIVNWGDGNTEIITNYSQGIHTYTSAGTYMVTITGTIDGWQFGNNAYSGDRNKLTEILQWGCLRLGNNGGYFDGCNNLILDNVIDVLDLTGVTTLTSMFKNCFSLTTINNINSWNTSSIGNMIYMFQNATSFNDNIGGWNVSNVLTTNGMFYGATSFNNGGSSSINNWQTLLLTDSSYMFYTASSFNQPIGDWDMNGVTNTVGMFMYAYVFNQNIGDWDVSTITNASNMFFNATSFNNNNSPSINSWQPIVLNNASGMFGSATSFNQPIGGWILGGLNNVSSMFNNATSFNQDLGGWASYMNTVSNASYMFYNATNFNNGGSASINNWNFTYLQSTTGMFAYATNFNQPIGNWNMSTVQQTNDMFLFATNFNQNIGSWDISAVVNMNAMFYHAINFNNLSNTSINNWQTINVQTMSGMFFAAISFNQPIGSWPTSTVTNMGSMFYNAVNFNQNIGAWNVTNVLSFSLMFFNAISFDNLGNNSIGTWILGTTNNINMSGMFRNAIIFNRAIGSWNTIRVTNMSQMFESATTSLFNQNIGGWNTSLVTNMSGMFKNATSFNNGGSSDINNWNTALVTNMVEMFREATSFNQPIGNWNTSLVTSMFSMFFGAINFNRSLATVGSSWNVSNVSNMSGMFYNAYAFDRPLSSWNISNVTNITNFMAGKSFTNYTASYLDDIYNAWAALTVNPNLNISFGVPPNGIKYTLAGAPGRASLVSTDNWSITDGGI